MNVLGISFAHHDSAAALVVDGVLIAAVSQERISRRKRDGIACGLRRTEVAGAAAYCLNAAGLSMRDVDQFVWSHIDHVSTDCLMDTLETEGWLELRDVETVAIPHHFAHACAAFFQSPFEQAAIMILDGAGGPLSGTRLHCCGPEADALAADEVEMDVVPGLAREDLREVESYYVGNVSSIRPIRKVLGQAYRSTIGPQYSAATWTLFGNPLHCGKTMGLSAYAEPAAQNLFFDRLDLQDRCVFIERRSKLRIEMEREIERWRADHGSANINECPQACRFAASIQHETENALLQQATWFREKTAMRNLCFGGGVALNCVANSVIARNAGFDRVFIPYAPGDDGVAIGCALFGAVSAGEWPTQRDDVSPRLGRSYAGESHHVAPRPYAGMGSAKTPHKSERAMIAAASAAPGVEALNCESPLPFLADALANGSIVAWFEGRSEFGPRALGGRCFLADPRIAEMPHRLNSITKRRELFRPFAPIVQAERVADYFVDSLPSSYMSFVSAVRPDWRNRLPGIAHVDGTARYQTLQRIEAPPLYDLLEHFHAKTGVAVLINTSFNVAGEPLVESTSDAVRCLLQSGADYLYMDGQIFRPLSEAHTT